MTCPLYMDQHVPSAMTGGLRRRNVDILTAQEDGAERWDDDDLLQRATELGRVMFSQDEDLLAIAHAWQQSGREFAGLIYTHQMGITIGRAVKDLEIVAKAMDVSDMRNQVLFLPL